MSRFAISDIHGCAATFKKLLDRISFSKEDILYLLGDYIDRGPDSKGVIDHIWYLLEEGYQVHCLRGNHEQMLLDNLKNDSLNAGEHRETLQSFQEILGTNALESYFLWMKALPYYFTTEDFILVHAGLNFGAENPLEDKREMIWIRYWYDDIDPQWLGDRIIVHGHSPTKQLDIKRSIEELIDIPAVNIDAGCVFESFGLGHLCAFNLDTKALTFEANVDTIQ